MECGKEMGSKRDRSRNILGKLVFLFSLPFILITPTWGYISRMWMEEPGGFHDTIQGFLTILVLVSVILNIVGVILGFIALFKDKVNKFLVLGIILNSLCLWFTFYALIHSGG